MRRLAVVLAGPLIARDDAVLMPDKLYEGLVAYARLWPGIVGVVAPRTEHDPSGNLGQQWRELRTAPFEVHLGEDVPSMLETLNPAVSLVPLAAAGVASCLRAPVVLAAEKSALERYRLAAAMGLTFSARARGLAAIARNHHRDVAAVRGAAGIQCNGYPVWEALGRHSSNALLYFDTRLTAAAVQAAAPRPHTERPLRLAFSGRLSPEKGPAVALDVQRRLSRRGLGTTLKVFGAGPQEEQLKAENVPGVTFEGPLSFDPDWIDRVTREVDLFVLPHPQGDPAGTYLEGAGLGVPFAAFANAAAASLARRHGVGWCVPIGRTDKLAALVAGLDADTDRVTQAGQRGHYFMTAHSFEREFERRVEHLLACASA